MTLHAKFHLTEMAFISWTIIFLYSCTFSSATLLDDILNVPVVDFVQNSGYPIERYPDVATEDKYLLDVYRIPYGRSGRAKQQTNPVILMHGAMRTCLDFLVMGPQASLAYLLADMGYDVWLPNARGTTLSRKHFILDPDTNPEFWNFSWHEIGLYDLPAIFELVENVTKKERFSYIGISEGTTAFFVMTSLKPHFNQKVTVMISLAPIAYIANLPVPLLHTAALYEPILTTLANSLGLNEFPPRPVLGLIKTIGRTVCEKNKLIRSVCLNVFMLIGGYDTDKLTKESLDHYDAILSLGLMSSSSCSVRQLLHSLQNAKSGFFRQFDFSPEVNMIKYGVLQPPVYNLSRITAPVALFYSGTDWLTSIQDVKRLETELDNCVYVHKVRSRFFSHFDFLLNANIKRLVFRKVFYLLKKYNEKNYIQT